MDADGRHPQGAVISPLLANIYLHPLDVPMTQQGYAMVRYADDFVILCPTAEAAGNALEDPMLRGWYGYFKHAHGRVLQTLGAPIRR